MRTDRHRTASSDSLARLRLEDIVRELYDVAFVPCVRNASALGFKTDEITRMITIDDVQGFVPAERLQAPALSGNFSHAWSSESTNG